MHYWHYTLITLEGVWNCGFVLLSSPIFTKQTRHSDKQALPRSLDKGQTSLPGILEHPSEYKGRRAFLESLSTLQGTQGDRLHVQKQTIFPLKPLSGHQETDCMYKGRQFSPWNTTQGTRRQTTKGQTSLRGGPGGGLFSCSLFCVYIFTPLHNS